MNRNNFLIHLALAIVLILVAAFAVFGFTMEDLIL